MGGGGRKLKISLSFSFLHNGTFLDLIQLKCSQFIPTRREGEGGLIFRREEGYKEGGGILEGGLKLFYMAFTA